MELIEISILKQSKLEFKSNKQNLIENLLLKKRMILQKIKSIETEELSVEAHKFKCLEETHYLLIRLPKMHQLPESIKAHHQRLLMPKVVDPFLLIGMIGMIQNTQKNKGKLLLISKRNKKNLKLRLVLRKRRRSLKRRKRVESQVVMFLMLTLMTTTQLTITLASTLLKNLTWIKKKIVIDMRKKKFRKI